MLDDADFRQIFSGSPIKRIGRERFVRNVIIAIANSGDKSFMEVLSARLDDTSAIVTEAAQWALGRLQQKP
jgi:epoxyqueuosine reductase